ncbi:MAG TPA: PAC2 family protein [Acidimicrobiia bacterium]|jgi:proteasome assembly chaperone (PAC2) family protein
MDRVSWQDRPALQRPVMVAAFEGWNDAADAASGALAWLRGRWRAKRMASIEPEEFFDFQVSRPSVSLVDGVTRQITWPANDVFSAHLEEVGRDMVLLSGVEPNLRWKTFCDTVLGVARETGCEMVVTLGALLADVPHTRPIRLTGTAADPELIERLGLSHSRYEGPTGIVGVLHDACRGAGVPSVSLWAPVPHYVASPPNPKATRALIERLAELIGVPVGVGDLVEAAAAWEDRVNELVASDPDVSAYVRQLEERDDDQIDEHDLPTGETLAAELERFLRDQRGS